VTARLVVRLTPRGGADRVERVGEDGTLHVRVAAPPVEGAANESLCRLLARALGIGRTAVQVVQGAAGRRKVLEIEVDPAQLETAWPGVATGGRG
jgi:hypothetical protein